MSVPSGNLRHRLLLQRQEESRSTYGEVTVKWIDVAKIWGQVAPQSGKEFVAAQSIQAQVDTRITIRYRDDVEAKNRIKFRDRLYDIQAVLPDNESGLEHLTLMCQSGVTDG